MQTNRLLDSVERAGTKNQPATTRDSATAAMQVATARPAPRRKATTRAVRDAEQAVRVCLPGSRRTRYDSPPSMSHPSLSIECCLPCETAAPPARAQCATACAEAARADAPCKEHAPAQRERGRPSAHTTRLTQQTHTSGEPTTCKLEGPAAGGRGHAARHAMLTAHRRVEPPASRRPRQQAAIRSPHRPAASRPASSLETSTMIP